MTFPLRGAPGRRSFSLLTVTALTLAALTLAAHDAGAQSARKSARAKPVARKVAPVPAAPIRFVIAPTGNAARYRVREQLMGANLPNDAIGVTNAITGTILAYPDGRIVKDSSRIVVDVRSLKSDKDRRDGFLQHRTLETDKYPTVELVPTEIRGFDGKLPASGPVTFQMLGDLTVHGVTRPTLWNVTARADGQDVAGTASTAFTFEDIALDQPRVPVVLSVADTIKLEYDFRFTREASSR